MALFKGKYEAKKFSAISSSDAFSSSRVFKGKQRLPFSLQRGSQSVWFDSDKIEEDQIVKLNQKQFYIPIKKLNFTDMMNTYLSSSLSFQSYTQISSSFFNKFNAMGPNDIIGIMAEDGPSPTSSFDIIPRNGISPFTPSITNTSILSTGASWSFSPGGPTHEIHHEQYTSSISHQLILSASVSSSIHLTGASSGSVKGIINTSTYPGIGTSILKLKSLGDGEISNTDLFYFSTQQELLVYPQGTTVNSSSLRYAILSQSVGSSDLITVYHSGSLNTGSYNSSSGSHIYLSTNFALTASNGWYLPEGSSTAIEVPNISIKYAAKRFNGNTASV